MNNNKVLIFGITGQDGSYLAEYLLDQGFIVHGVVRKTSTPNTANIEHLLKNSKVFNQSLFIHHGDLLDSTSIYRLIHEVRPVHIYNEADQDHVSWSKEIPDYSIQTTISGPLHIFEAVRILNPEIKIFQPVSSNIFGVTNTEIQDELTPLNPVSPYAISKAATFQLIKYYREQFKLRIYCAILYNHESPRRSHEYVTRKISSSAVLIKNKELDKLVLGDIEARLDWGYAPEYMSIAHKILESSIADDFIVATGKLYSVKEFAQRCFDILGLDFNDLVTTSDLLKRKMPTSTLSGDTTKLEKVVGIKPKVFAMEIAEIMVTEDLRKYDRL